MGKVVVSFERFDGEGFGSRSPGMEKGYGPVKLLDMFTPKRKRTRMQRTLGLTCSGLVPGCSHERLWR